MRAGRAALVGAGLAVAAGGVAWAVPRLAARRLRARPDDPDATLEPPVTTAVRFPSHDGGTVHVVRAGEGRPIVLSHGVTLSVQTWTKQLRSLPAHGFEVVAFDHRGHGASTVGESGHSLENLGHDVGTVLEALDLRDAVLVGHSMGGVAVQHFLLDHPEVAAERVRGVVLLSTLARSPFGSRSTQLRRRVERLTRRTPDSTRVWASPTLGFLLARIGFGLDPRPSHVELVRRMMLECADDTRREAPLALVGLDVSARLPEITVPTLVIGGTRDVLTPPDMARHIARRIPGARLELVEGVGHMMMLERPEELDRLVVDFAREVGDRHGTTTAAAR